MGVSPTGEQIARLEESFRAAPGSRVFAALADAYRDLGRLDDAVALLKRGTARHPDYVSALVLQAQCELQMGRIDDAEATFARVAALDPENLVALKYRAERSASRGGADQAAALLQRVLEIDPFDSEARSARQRLHPAEPMVSAADPGPSDASTFDALGAAPANPAQPTAPDFAGDPAVADAPTAATTPPVFGATEPAVAAGATGIEADALGRPVLESGTPAPEGTPLPEIPFETGASSAAPDGTGAPKLPSDVATPPVAPESEFLTPGLPDADTRPEEDRSAHVPPPLADRRGRSMSDWHVQRADDRIVVRQGPDPGPGESDLEPPPRPTDEFSTLTLARIYESQGYLDKALGIYQDLYEKHPQHPEVLERLRALQERMAGFEDAAEGVAHPRPVDPRPSLEIQPREAVRPQIATPAPAPSDSAVAAWSTAARAQAADTAAAAPGLPTPSGDEPTWRLLDVGALDAEATQTAEKLRSVTDEVRARELSKRHTVIGTSSGAERASPAPTPEASDTDAGAVEQDFERFLRYVRSIKR